MNRATTSLCLIGAGPRGLSVLERLCARLRTDRPAADVIVHVVDPYPPGAGQVWRTDQPLDLLMNTVASQVTLFTDDSVRVDGPLEPGPSLYEWARFVTLMGPFEDGVFAEAVLAEAARLGPDDYPTRALYGHYLAWVFRRVAGRAPEGVGVRVHRSRAVALDDTDGGTHQRVRLEDGTVLDGLDAVVLSQGHVAARPTSQDRELAAFSARFGLVHHAPANPADVDHSAARPGEPVLLRGLGLNFFDHMALLTSGRGGRFERRGGTLVYLPSGREPLLCAGSRRGVPHHARGENEKGAHGRYYPRLLTPDTIARLRRHGAEHGGLDFRRDLWPLISREVEAVYYEALVTAAGQPARARALAARLLAAPPAEHPELLTEAGVEPDERWDWARVHHPYGAREFSDEDAWRTWLEEYLERDVAAARAGNVSGPLKAALDVFRDLRNEVRLLVDHQGLRGRSHHDDLDRWYTPLNAFLSIGPPAVRIEQMLALIRAGILRIAGPGARVHADARTGAFVMESDVPGARFSGSVLVEARLPEPDLRTADDPLLRHLLDTGQCTSHRVPDPDDADHVTGGLAVTERPYRVRDAQGRPHPRRFAHGVPTEGVHWVTAAGIRPGVDSVTLGDSDAIAAALVSVIGSPAAIRAKEAMA
ncbi:putative NAD(P)/FAD-binding protein YdhS [Streptomyces griseochromogenes]|uniref:FAD-binding protein n=1 Tax=Streptomyces griseochromogenes TaxID=68214 RepID=A0A1B1B7X6_9ACTN|nr:FAD/NAD(P)-binding protein [Streptomyces griseochromogenes]ANP54936.1 FAD-binding protein [Streptomyces griseochromogenes]MBP2050679.1 putative NAD(P)/FAD-binding protein YdhS [Streptomyces griseochromogenes]